MIQPRRAFALLLALASALTFAACHDEITRPGDRVAPTTTRVLGAIVCTVQIESGEATCQRRMPGGGVSRTIVTDPTSSELLLSAGSFNRADSTFSLTARIRNYGRNDVDFLGGDGTTATGIDLFLAEDLTAWQTGGVQLYDAAWPRNHDGVKEFTAPDQPYWHWADMLGIGGTTSTRTLKFTVLPNVTSLQLVFNISAEVPADGLGPKVVVTNLGGVTGTFEGVYYKHQGDTMHYVFTAAPGNDSAQVMLDGVFVADTGSFVVDSTHTLVVSADSIRVLLPAGMALVTARRAILTAANKPAAYEAYLAQVGALADSVGADEARSIVALAEFQAIDPVADDAALRAEDAALANHSFRIGSYTIGGPGTSQSRRGGPRRTATGGAGVADTSLFYYINGINTTVSEANDTRRSLDTLLTEITFDRPVHAVVNHFYSRTYRVQNDPLAARRESCSLDMVRASEVVRGLSLLRRWGRCMQPLNPYNYYIGDLWESWRQVVELQTDLGALPEDAELFSDSISHYANLGWKVVVLPHSQGNLMTQQAVNRMVETDTTWENDRPLCVGAVPLASPLSEHWMPPFRPAELYPVLVEGDIIYTALGMNDWPTFPNALTDSLNAKLEDAQRIKPAFARQVVERWHRLIWGVRIHKIDTSYLQQTTSRARIVDGIRTVHRNLGRRCGPGLEISGPDRVGRGATVQLAASMVRPGAPPQDVTDDVTWSSLTPALATVSQAGVVTGVAVGTARIVAETADEAHADTFLVRVFDPRGIIGDWAGTWNNDYRYNQPYTEGSITLSVTAPGTQASSATGSFALGWKSGVFSGPFPEVRASPINTTYTRGSWGYTSLGINNLMTTVHVYTEVLSNNVFRGQLVLTVQTNEDGQTATGSLAECQNYWFGECWLPYAPIGNVRLTRVE